MDVAALRHTGNGPFYGASCSEAMGGERWPSVHGRWQNMDSAIGGNAVDVAMRTATTMSRGKSMEDILRAWVATECSFAFLCASIRGANIKMAFLCDLILV